MSTEFNQISIQLDGWRDDSLTVLSSGDGIHVIELKKYEDFIRLLDGDFFLNRPEYVYRGHRDPSWKLSPVLYRNFDRAAPHTTFSQDSLDAKAIAETQTAKILRNFVMSLRGTQYLQEKHVKILAMFQDDPRLHINTLFDRAKSDSELLSTIFETWALGQHHGLLTPLLDWSESPLSALYFAFEKEETRKPTPEHRVVYALNRKLISDKCSHSAFPGERRIAFINPLTRHNHRLLNQRGLFTYSFDFRPMEEWIAEVFQGQSVPALFRILIPNLRQPECLRWLNRIGINAQTIFPDLIGICNYCNHSFRDEKLGWSEE